MEGHNNFGLVVVLWVVVAVVVVETELGESKWAPLVNSDCMCALLTFRAVKKRELDARGCVLTADQVMQFKAKIFMFEFGLYNIPSADKLVGRGEMQ